MKNQKSLSQYQGFTLIELMIVVVIVAILAAVAYPSYQSSLQKSRRAEARAQLLEVAQFMQRFYSQNDRYDQTNAATPQAVAIPSVMAVAPKGAASGTQNYNIGFQANTLTRSAYTLEAVPRSGGFMATDKCGTLRINSVGARSITGTGATVEECWR